MVRAQFCAYDRLYFSTPRVLNKVRCSPAETVKSTAVLFCFVHTCSTRLVFAERHQSVQAHNVYP